MNQEQRQQAERIMNRADRKIWVKFQKEGIHKYPAAGEDPMLATGASLAKTIQHLRQEGQFAELHIVVAIACTTGIELVKRQEPSATIWCGAIDEELTAKSYIVPGLGDAGDLSFGTKRQN
mgnify:CR=1 FL=1